MQFTFASMLCFLGFFLAMQAIYVSANPAIDFLASKQDGTNVQDSGQGIAIDGDDIYVSGISSGDFDGANAGQSDLVATKYMEKNGVMQSVWTWQDGTSLKEFADGGSCLADDGNFVVVGRTQGDLYGTNAGTEKFDIVVVKLSATDGTVMNSYQVGSEGDDYAEDVYCDDSGNVYVVGFTSGPFFNASAVVSNTTNDYIAFKMDLSDGSIQWGVQRTSGHYDYLYGVTMSYDQTQLIAVGLSNGNLFAPPVGGTDFVAVSFNPTTGDIIWSQQWGTTETDMLIRADIDPTSGNVMTTGWSAGSDYGTNEGSEDVVVVKLDVTDGSVMWGAQYGSPALDNSISIKCDEYGDAWVGGYTQGTLFDAYQGGTDSFVMKVSGEDGQVLYSDQNGVSTTQNDAIQGLVVNEDNNAWYVGSSGGSLFGTNIGQGDIVSFSVGCEYGWESSDTCSKQDSDDNDDDDDSTATAIVATAVSLVGVGLIGFGGYYYYTKKEVAKPEETTPYSTLNG